MNAFDDEWTTAHDLALLYSGLACVDRDLADEEVSAIKEPLAEWVPLSVDTTTEEVVREAAAALKQSRQSVRGAVDRIDRRMSPDERRETLRDLLRIARADGVVLGAERELLHHLATAWDLKQLRTSEGEPSESVSGRRGEEWTVFHELSFLFVQVGYGAEDHRTADVLGPMLKRLHEWKPTATDGAVRSILQQALDAFAEREEEPLIQDSVEALEAALPPVQRLLVLDDLHAVAPLDESSGDTARHHLRSLAEAWNVAVRVRPA
jgi:uncharacterized tellurite resistance protein B-like protein